MSNAVQTAVSAYLSGRNRIINGNAVVNQRQAVATPVAGTFQYGGPDRFAAVIGNTTGGAFTQNQPSAADTNGTSQFWVRQTVGTVVPDLSGTKYWGGITQLIEGTSCYDLKGFPGGVSVSFQFLATLSGRYSLTLFDSSLTYSYTVPFTYAVGGVPQYFSFPIPTLPTAMGMNATGANYLAVRIGGLNAGSWQCPPANEKQWVNTAYYNATGVTNWSATIGNYISATTIQLEPGPIATPFDYKNFGDHLRDCQRYYHHTYIYGTAAGTAGQDTSALWCFTGPTAQASSFLNAHYKFPVSMRVQPNGTVWNPHNAATTGSAWAQNAAASLAAAVQSSSTEHASIGLQAAATTVGDFIKFHAAFSAEF